MVAIHQGMKDQTDTNIARDGAPKRTAGKAPVHPGMKDQTDASRLSAAPSNPGWGPDADPTGPNVKEPRGKSTPDAKIAWGMKDANGQSINGELGKKVLAEAANLGR